MQSHTGEARDTSLLPSLIEAVREGRTRHFADITDEGDREDDDPAVVEGDVKDVRLGTPDSQPELELNAPANSDATSRSAKSETHAEPEAEVSTSAGTDMEIGVNDRRVRFREERDPSRHHLDVSSDRELTEEPLGKMPRRAETNESVVPFHSSEASSSELQQVSTAAASDNPTGERLYLSMTEEGPTGDFKMTMQRDRNGRWMPTKGERTMNIQKAREERRNFYVGRSQEHGIFSIASAEASPLHGTCLSQSTERRRGILRRANAVFERNRNRMARKPGSLRWSITTKCMCSIKCLLLNAGRGQARHA